MGSADTKYTPLCGKSLEEIKYERIEFPCGIITLLNRAVTNYLLCSYLIPWFGDRIFHRELQLTMGLVDHWIPGFTHFLFPSAGIPGMCYQAPEY